ncbi:hypothetical protein [Noviherbaspirillum saxi]|uniref:Uncharacterized protein n=1 Tax=Noviherbaspirillum saxi TaxID=2320863 RepID=A0A3A3G534_9BURK|nr:hypothetical protein [Noviherbaspirillum saxi]RJF97245.1 hypothetical protein D3871_00870 [Noviherbaspirillum saxi]
MSPDIVIVREGDGYRLLHGHLRLANELGQSGAVDVEVRGEGRVSIVRHRSEYEVHRDGQRLPLYRQ